jgi:hypothetical protein
VRGLVLNALRGLTLWRLYPRVDAAAGAPVPGAAAGRAVG